MKAILLLLAAAALLISFQNCTKTKFAEIASTVAPLSVLVDPPVAPPDVPKCTELTPDTFAPRLKWDWVSKLDFTNLANFPDYVQVMATPVVGDLNKDGISEVVFVSWSRSENNSYNGRGILRIVNGATGETIRSEGTPAIAPFASTTPLLIDIDGNGMSEIVYSHYLGKNIIALNHDGTLRWNYEIPGLAVDEVVSNKTSFSAFDLDGDGKAEIIVGHRAFSEDASGNVKQKWQGEAASVSGYSYAINLDPALPNEPRVVGHAAVYDRSGKVLFKMPPAFYAAGNIDNTPGLELVGTGGGMLRIVNGITGEVKLELDMAVYSELQCPKGIGGGGATLGDFDGNVSTVEIAVATGRYLTIFDSGGALIAKSATQDCSSLATGISSFDFNGDGKPEILYGDEEYFRVFEMKNGQLQVVWSTPNPSGTLNEYPVVADIDGNGSSELLVVSNNYAVAGFYKDEGEAADAAAALTITGVRAFESGNASPWMQTRSLWNSWNYNPAFVTDDLRSVTRTSTDNFTSRLFKRNVQLTGFETRCVTN